ncbi:aminodeoxychorismate synthase component I [Thiohalorhabdus methylotrophus]|uniref:aminodeoxychorismate synthase n=1 Tax=Thiohalorhabdus methylotrophus TaxID=3242694 RepID=A0ABV4TXB4_9GAMM
MKGWPRIHEIPYFPDSADRFSLIADHPWAIFLDSGSPYGAHIPNSRFDILSADPWATLTQKEGRITVRTREGTHIHREDPFTVLREYLRPEPVNRLDLPFTGGAMGYFSYDLARSLESLPSTAEDSDHLPEMAVGIYDWAVVVDHAVGKAWLVGYGRDPETARKWSDLVRLFKAPVPRSYGSGLELRSEISSNLDDEGYGRAFERVKEYIRAGDCYQVNLAQRFSAQTEGHPWSGYRALRASNPAPFGAYLNVPGAQILSNSPERFLQVAQGKVETRPIKGTRPRSESADRDRALARELVHSPKDRAENVMIVDLLRNDLGRVCTPGSVRVPELFGLESFPTVHHLVSTVTGTLPPERDSLDLLRACFPGGSITGAPKIRAMEIIEEVEPHRRGVYCGSIGYVSYDGTLDSNIAIRTLVHMDGVVRFWAGGGLVMDSQRSDEYTETFDKAAAMLELLNHARAENVGH